MGMSVVLQVFGHKAKCWTHEHVDLMMALHEKSEDHQSSYSSSWGEHECVYKMLCHPSRRCWNISQDKRKPWSDCGATGKVRGSLKMSGFILWATWISVPFNRCWDIQNACTIQTNNTKSITNVNLGWPHRKSHSARCRNSSRQTDRQTGRQAGRQADRERALDSCSVHSSVLLPVVSRPSSFSSVWFI